MARGGQVISRPQREHACDPGWRPYYVAEGDPLGFGPGWYTHPPWASDYPKGTVWQCDCGQVWVSSRAERGMAVFRRERRRERHRRLRE